MSLTGNALNAMISNSVGPTPVSMYDIVVRVFGQPRVEAYLKKKQADPELEAFCEEFYEMIDDSWKQKGVSDEVGPYLQ